MPVAILMPALSPTMTEGNVAKWIKKEGETIKSGDIIAEVETDKATMEVEAIDEGVLAKIIHNDGSENISVNSLIGIISTDGDTNQDIEMFLKNKGDLQETTPQKDSDKNIDIKPNSISNSIKVENTKVENKQNNKNLILDQSTSQTSISPLAKRIASLNNIDISKIIGSGPRGRIIKRDLDTFLKTEDSLNTNSEINISNIETQSSKIIPLTNIRKTIANKLQKSKQNVPHFYLKSKVNADEIINARKIINSLKQNSEDQFKVSYNDIIIKSVASALKTVPEMNRTWNEDSILQYNIVDISVAVATEQGLFTPVIKSACKKSISDISQEMKGFIIKAKNNKLTPEDYTGGSFSISNLGMYNVNEFTAIINPPQSGILAIGEIFEELKIVDDKVSNKNMMNLVLSVDHRVADGAVAAIFLDKIKFFLENPLGMLA